MNQRDVASVIVGGNRVILPPSLPDADVSGNPYSTISSDGISNGSSDKFNGGAEFGRDTPGTITNGFSELISKAISEGAVNAALVGKNIITIRNPVKAFAPASMNNVGSFTLRGNGWLRSINAADSVAGNDMFTFENLNSPQSAVMFTDTNFQDYTATGINSFVNSSMGPIYLERISVYGRNLAKYGFVLSGGLVYVKDSLFDFMVTAAILINDPSGGVFFINNCSFGNGGAQLANEIYISIINGLGGTYNILDCNMTGSGTGVTGLSITGQTTDLYVIGCSFDCPVGLNLDAIINTSIIKDSSFTSGSIVQFGSNFYPDKFRIKDCPGFNPVGLIASPFETTSTPGPSWVGIGAPSGTAAPVASTAYRAEVTDLVITSTGGTAVSITITDAAGTTIASGLTTLTNYYLPAGFSINFGAFTAAPTVTVFGM